MQEKRAKVGHIVAFHNQVSVILHHRNADQYQFLKRAVWCGMERNPD
jgi:hypothetical protein